ncbi:MAG: hypothetical protein K9J06_06145 [Flavobacteriales bacterium]|nr:hypothetical protein [Flavobacteriales bacterium]
MRTKSTLMTLALAVVFAFAAQAQRMTLTSGTFKALSGQSEVNLVYKYDGMKVGLGKKAVPEDEYIEKKKGEYNKKETGRGDKWEGDWAADRENKYHGKFEELLNKGMKGMVFGRNKSGAKYTLIVHTTTTEPGWNIPFVGKQPSLVDMTISLVETGNEGSPLGVMTLAGAPGTTYGYGDWDTGIRIQESYAKAGKSFAGWLPKKGMK